MPEACSLPDASAVLCEHCGYHLDGLFIDGAGICPECGTPIAASIRAGHPGSPAQRRLTARTWFQTGWLVLRRPRQAFDQMLLRRRSAGELYAANVIFGGALIALKPTLAFVATIGLSYGTADSLFFTIAVVVGLMLACECVFALLFGLPYLLLTVLCGGVTRLVASLLTWRWNGPIASTVTSHAACAVAVAWGLVTVAEIVAGAAAVVVMRHSIQTDDLWHVLIQTMMIEYIVATAAVLSYTLIGAHRLRFANAC